MIPIKNIYYMLAYSYRMLNRGDNQVYGIEKFENIHSLLTDILVKGINRQIKRGLYKEYVGISDSLNTVRGSINLSQTMQIRIQQSNKIVCDFDELTVNNQTNQIIKSVLFLLIKHPGVRSEVKMRGKKTLILLDGIGLIDLQSINWKLLSNKKIERNQAILLGICQLIVEGMLMSDSDGNLKLAEFLDDQQMHQLFESFVREYYKLNYPQLRPSSTTIQWQYSGENIGIEYLPGMQTDITLSDKKRVHIIDTKYYSKNLSSYRERKILSSANLYQIFSYVKNKQIEVGHSQEVSGLLLYARTDAEIQPDAIYQMSGNTIAVRTLDLLQDFSGIEFQLKEIICDFFQ